MNVPHFGFCKTAQWLTTTKHNFLNSRPSNSFCPWTIPCIQKTRTRRSWRAVCKERRRASCSWPYMSRWVVGVLTTHLASRPRRKNHNDSGVIQPLYSTTNFYKFCSSFFVSTSSPFLQGKFEGGFSIAVWCGKKFPLQHTPSSHCCVWASARPPGGSI